MTEVIKVTTEDFERDPDRYLSEVGDNRSIEIGEDIVVVSKADWEAVNCCGPPNAV